MEIVLKSRSIVLEEKNPSYISAIVILLMYSGKMIARDQREQRANLLENRASTIGDLLLVPGS